LTTHDLQVAYCAADPGKPLDNPQIAMSQFRILSNHGLTLLCISRDPMVRMHDLAQELGITERGAQRIVAELVEAGLVDRRRIGRRNRYRVRSERVIQLPIGQRLRVGRLLEVLCEAPAEPLPPAQHLHRQAGRLFAGQRDWTAYLAERSEGAVPPRLPAVDAAMIATDLQGVVRLWNRQAERLYGWQRHEVVGRMITELTVGPEDSEVADNIMRAVRQRGSWEGEFWVRRRDGTRFLAYVQDAVVRNGQGAAIGMVGLSLELPASQPSLPGETAPSQTDS
jgi:PAS domain S-box-containing protein